MAGSIATELAAVACELIVFDHGVVGFELENIIALHVELNLAAADSFRASSYHALG